MGILTSVVSVIRVCGSSSLRAFIGRAQEGPGDAENELLSCVSETTAELFNTGGISRVFGRPRVLEVVAWEAQDDSKETSLVIGTLRDALREKAWFSSCDGVSIQDYDVPALDIPNLSLNKGIKRRKQIWFYCAAVFGGLLQAGVIAYSTLTVFILPDDFQHNDKSVPAYAFPFFVLGTVLLSSGMFLCAFIIERSSKEYYFYPAKPSKIYWLQPGRQKVGDQVFGAFMGVSEGRHAQPTTDLTYIKSIKSSKYATRKAELILTISITILGFVVQFVGLRGLHPSVIMAQMGATLIMSIVRTCLRTKRIDAEENQLSTVERELTSHNQQELDCLAFHLENIESFELQSSAANEETTLVSENERPALKTNIIRIRTSLTELTSGTNQLPNLAWNDLPIRRIAQSLARTIEMTMDLLSKWENRQPRFFEFRLPFRCQPLNPEFSSDILDRHTIRLERTDDTLRWKVNEKELEAVLGLWTWSLLKSSEHWRQKGLGRLVGLHGIEAGAEETDLYFHKWIFRQTEARMVSSEMIHSGQQLFGFYSDELPDEKEILVVKTQNGLETMGAQDLFIRFLNCIFEEREELGGSVDVLPGLQNTFLAQNTRLDELVTCFESGNLGSREDAMLCIVPTLKHQNLLPELAADSPDVRKRLEELISGGKWTEAFSLIRWLCERCEGDEFERSTFELGYLCRLAMLHSDPDVRQTGVREVYNILKGDIRASYFMKLRSTRKTGWMRSRRQSEWWDSFSTQLGWIAWHLSQQSPDRQHIQSSLEAFSITESCIFSRFNCDAERGRNAFLRWISYKEKNVYDADHEDALPRVAFDWARLNGFEFLLHCLFMVWMEVGEKRPELLFEVVLLAARCRLRSAIQCMTRHGLDINMDDPSEGKTPLIQAVTENNTNAARELLDNGAAIDGRSPNGQTPLITAAYGGDRDMVKFLLQHGASIDAQDDDGFTALLWATYSNQMDVINVLLANGADIERAGTQGHTALVIAVEQNHLEALLLLLQRGANMNTQLNEGSTPLMSATRCDHPHAARVLLEWGADLYTKDWNGETVLDKARGARRLAIIPILEQAMGVPSHVLPS